MVKLKNRDGMKRREFIKIGLMGTTSTILAGNVLADAVQAYAQLEQNKFSAPV